MIGAEAVNTDTGVQLTGRIARKAIPDSTQEPRASTPSHLSFSSHPAPESDLSLQDNKIL
jgi:hypothetical protein